MITPAPSLSQAAVEPKPIIAGLEYALDLDGLARARLRVAPVSLKEFDQCSGIAPVYPAAGDLPRDRVTDGQQPGRLAQLDRHQDRRVRVGRTCRLYLLHVYLPRRPTGPLGTSWYLRWFNRAGERTPAGTPVLAWISSSIMRWAAKARSSRTRSPSAPFSISSIRTILSSVIVISGSRFSLQPNPNRRPAVTAPRTARCAAPGSARRPRGSLLHHVQGHQPSTSQRASRSWKGLWPSADRRNRSCRRLSGPGWTP